MRPSTRSWVAPVLRAALGLALAGLAGCDNPTPPPAPDKFQPTRPTNAGSLSDALRRSPARILRGGEAPAPIPPGFPVPPSPAAHLDDTTRGVVQEYLVTLTRVNTTLQSIGDPALAPDAVERLAPLVDSWRASMDYLAMVPEGVQREIRRDYADQLRDLGRDLDRHLGRLEDRPAFSPLLTLVRDVPRFAADEPTPAPQPIHAGASSPASEPD